MRALKPSLLHLGAVLSAVAALAAGCVFRSADDCALNLGYGCGNGGAGTGASGTGAGSSTSTTSSSGTGGMPECTTAATCPGVPPGPCASLGVATCTAGKCGLSYTAGPAPSQQYGSCKKKVCDGKGVLTEENDDTNVYDDGNPCTEETCTSGVPGQKKLYGSSCALGGSAGYCADDPRSGLIVCSECDPNGAPTCSGNAVCVQGTCVPLHCTNGLKDGSEIDLNCGGTGSGCLPCDNFRACLVPADCLSGVCTSLKCATPACNDSRQNQDETDTDCGGKHCQPCMSGSKCLSAGDCDTGVCKAATAGAPNTCQPPSCTDGVKNGDEEDIDCGGSLSQCPPCGG